MSAAPDPARLRAALQQARCPPDPDLLVRLRHAEAHHRVRALRLWVDATPAAAPDVRAAAHAAASRHLDALLGGGPALWATYLDLAGRPSPRHAAAGGQDRAALAGALAPLLDRLLTRHGHRHHLLTALQGLGVDCSASHLHAIARHAQGAQAVALPNPATLEVIAAGLAVLDARGAPERHSAAGRLAALRALEPLASQARRLWLHEEMLERRLRRIDPKLDLTGLHALLRPLVLARADYQPPGQADTARLEAALRTLLAWGAGGPDAAARKRVRPRQPRTPRPPPNRSAEP